MKWWKIVLLDCFTSEWCCDKRPEAAEEVHERFRRGHRGIPGFRLGGF
jgi:hypothetical protein